MDNNTVYKAKEMMFGLQHDFDYLQCAKCSCLQIQDIPENIADYYPEYYYSYEPLNNNTKTNFLVKKRDQYAVLKKGLIGTLLNYLYPNPDLTFYSKLIPCPYKTKVLDVGCGS